MTAGLRRASLAACFTLALACAPHPPLEGAHPAAHGLPAPPLPAIPLREGPLAIRVVYPPAGALIATRDSNFIFGSVGHGDATLTIDGREIAVHPNGAFIAFLPVPGDAAAGYELVAVSGLDTARTMHPVRVPPPRPELVASGPLVVDTASLAPTSGLLFPADEEIRISLRAPRNASVWAEGSGGSRRTLAVIDAAPTHVFAALAGVHADSARLIASGAGAGAPGATWRTDVPARWLAEGLSLVAAREGDTIRLALPRADTLPARGRWGVLGSMPAALGDTDRVIHGRPLAAGTYRWAFLAGTMVRVTGAEGEFVRIALGESLDAWVARDDVGLLPLEYGAPSPVVSNMRVVPGDEWADVVFPMGARAPHLIEVEGDRMIVTLYGARANTDIIRWVAGDSLIENITWVQEARDRARYTLHLREPPFGWLAFWDGFSLVVRVRRAPGIDSRAPLRGLTIAVDAGHPPAGATGPTGVYEAGPVLEIARRLRTILEGRGATVIMTRDSPEPVALAQRPVIARRAGAHALVSIHLNALPDGVNPFRAHGTGAYFFHPPSEPLAREIQRGMVERMGLRNLGVYYDNLALVRPTWMPSVLCEGAFLMMPEQEYAVTTPAFQERYARGVADGLERYFRALGAR